MASAMHGAVRELQAPTGVTHALRGRFGDSSSSGWGLVFVKRTSIELYNVCANDAHARLSLLAHTDLPAAVASAAALRRPGAAHDFLWLGFSSMRVAALAWDASVRDWHTLQTIDLAVVINRQSAEMRDTTRDSQRPMSSVPGDEHRVLIRGRYCDSAAAEIRVDDKGRCAGVLAASLGTLVVLPMRGDADLAAAAEAPSACTGKDVLVNEEDVFTIDLREQYGVSNVKDFVFLDDCFEPTVVLLHEPKRTWAGRVSVLRNTAELVAISIDLRNKTHNKAWEMHKLPSDAHKVIAVPGSAGGGVLVFSPNVLMQVRHEACAAGLSLNSFGDEYAKELEATYGAIVKSKTLMSLDSARCAFLDDLDDSSTAVVSLKGGELFFLTVAGKSRTTISMVRAGSTVLTAAIVPINRRFFVLASRLSDSLLIEYRQGSAEGNGDADVSANPAVLSSTRMNNDSTGEMKDTSPAGSVADGGANSDDDGKSGGADSSKKSGKRSSTRRRRTAEEEAEYEMLYGSKPPLESDSEEEGEDGNLANLELIDKDEGTRGVYDDDDELGMVFHRRGEKEASRSTARTQSWSLVVKDTLPGYGPAADLAVGRSPGDGEGGALDVVVAGGYAKNGCLGVLQHSLRPHDITRFVLAGFTQAWTVRDPSLSRREEADRDARNRKRVETNAAVRERNDVIQASRDKWVSEQLESIAKKSAPVGDTENGSDKSGGAEILSVTADDEGVASVEPATKRMKIDDGGVEMADGVERNAEGVSDEAAPPTIGPGSPEGGAGNPSDVAMETGPTAEQIAEIEANAAQEFPLEAEEVLEALVADVSDIHSYLLLSKPSATVVMKTGDDLEELGSGVVDFLTDVGTLAAGNVLGQVAIVQVHAQGARVLKDSRVAVEHSLVPGSPAVALAQVSDPFVLLLLTNGSVIVLKVTADEIEAADVVSDMDDALDDGDLGIGGGDQKKEKVMKRYRNLQLSVDYTLEPGQAGNLLSSACIYRGPLADAASRKVCPSGAEPVADLDKMQSEGAGIATDSAAAGNEGTGAVDGAGSDMDEEDFMLYGDGGGEDETAVKSGTGQDGTSGSPGAAPGKPTELDDDRNADSHGAAQAGSGVFPLPSSAASVYTGASGQSSLLLTTTKDGALEMRRMESPSYELVFRCAHFFLAPQLVLDDGCAVSGEIAVNDKFKAKKKDRITSLVLTHVTGTAQVRGLATPVLVAVQASGFPLIYRPFVAPAGVDTKLAVSRVRLSRVASNSFTTGILQASSSSSGKVPLVPFENVAGRGGVFVGGKKPFFVFAERGFPRAHPVRCPAPAGAARSGAPSGVTGFAELHNVNCPRGFVSITHDGVVGISELPSSASVNMDAPVPFRKVPLRCTPHKVAYHAGSSTYGVLASMPTLTTREDRLARILQSLEKHDKRHYESTVAQAEAETGDERLVRIPPLFEELHELRIYRPDGWQLIKSYKLQKGEVGLAIANISVDVWKQRAADSSVPIPSTNRLEDGSESLFAASIKLRPKNMLVVGTGFLNGEDATSRGRLLMFEVSRQEAYAEGSGMYTAFQLQLIAEKELPAPVTAVAPMQGYVVAGVGPQLGVYKLVQDEIVYLSFAFGQLFCTSIASLNQYVLSADMYKSVAFHFFRDRNTSVNFLGKDYSHISAYASEFLLDNEDMSIVLSDAEGNLHMLGYANANVPESRGGKRLLLSGGVNYGSRINKFQRVRLNAEPSIPNLANETSGQHAALFVTLDGGLGAIVPIKEDQFQKLSRLADVMFGAVDVARHAGLDPKDAHTFRPASSSTQLLNQRLIDTRLALEALFLQPSRARIVSKMAGLGGLDELISLCSFLDAVLDRF